jgi:hypothetical protein
MNLFSWSMPFVIEKCSEVLYHLIKPDDKFDETGEMPLELLMSR